MRLFAFLNYSQILTPTDITAMAEACTIQIVRHLAPAWNKSPIYCFPRKLEQIQGDDFVPRLCFFDEADDATALGYHSVGPDGLPYAKVFVNPILDSGGGVLGHSGDGNCVSVTASHEACETAIDESADDWCTGPARPEGADVAKEVCDMVQSYAYDITTRFGTVAVSDFATPAYFSDGPGPYDYLGKLSAPWSVAPGGYLIVRDSTGKVSNIFGKSKQPPHPASRLARRGG